MTTFSMLRPFVFLLPPETAHTLTITLLKNGLVTAKQKKPDAPILQTDLLGLSFPNPVGLAAGFDKNADVMDQMLAAGFGWVEAGTVTPEPQSGNEKPRIFRLPENHAVINRLGFNNNGLAPFVEKFRKRKGKNGIVGANVGANKNAEDRTEDYVTGIKALNGLPSYFTVNISSPNTPGLRALQSKEALQDLLTRVIAARDLGAATPILLKIAPDLTEQDKKDIAEVALLSKIDGLIISNTTISRPDELMGKYRKETGGLSGEPLMPLSTQTLYDMYALTKGKVPLVGVGGIASGEDAYRKICAGASLVQVYTGMIYQGIGLVSKIKEGLETALRRDGFSSVQDAVGADHR